MARYARVVLPGHPHHVIQRGNRRQRTFFCADDYRAYLILLAEYCKKWGVAIWAYCLMPNHVHLIAVPGSREGFARAIADVHCRYTRRINFRYRWRGHLWQSRFGSYPMDERHLLAAVRYVELNPSKARLCNDPQEYPWSSARVRLLGISDGLTEIEPLSSRIGDWKAYLAQGICKEDSALIEQHGQSGRPLGDPEFIMQVESLTGRMLRRRKPGPKLEGGMNYCPRNSTPLEYDQGGCCRNYSSGMLFIMRIVWIVLVVSMPVAAPLCAQDEDGPQCHAWKDPEEVLASVFDSVMDALDRMPVYGEPAFSDRIDLMYYPEREFVDENPIEAGESMIYAANSIFCMTHNDSELAFAIAHEIAHIYKKHIPDFVSKADRLCRKKGVYAKLKLEVDGPWDAMTLRERVRACDDSGMVEGLLNVIKRKQEKEADLMAKRLMARAGFDPKAAASAMRHIFDHAWATRLDPPQDRYAVRIERSLTHGSGQEREALLRDGSSWVPGERISKDNCRAALRVIYEAMKEEGKGACKVGDSEADFLSRQDCGRLTGKTDFSVVPVIGSGECGYTLH